MAGKRKQRKCRFCKKRPPWQYKNCPPGVCKRCYHKHVWVDRPAARRQRQATEKDTSLPGELPDYDVGLPGYDFYGFGPSDDDLFVEVGEPLDDGEFLDESM